jgi:hypothetical protein
LAQFSSSNLPHLDVNPNFRGIGAIWEHPRVAKNRVFVAAGRHRPS